MSGGMVDAEALMASSPSFQKAELSEQEVALITDVVSHVLVRSGLGVQTGGAAKQVMIRRLILNAA